MKEKIKSYNGNTLNDNTTKEIRQLFESKKIDSINILDDDGYVFRNIKNMSGYHDFVFNELINNEGKNLESKYKNN